MITLQKRNTHTWLVSTVSALLSLSMCACATGSSAGPGKTLSATEHARMLIEIANGAIMEGDATGALENLFQAEKEAPGLPELYHSKALAFSMKHDIPTALAQARKAVAIKPDYADANNTLGKLLIDSGRSDEAIAPLTRAANDPIYREAFKSLTNLGIIHYRRGNYERAEHFLTRAVVDAPAVACVAYYYRGHLRLRDSRFKEAVADYDSAGRKSCASFADAHLAMGIAYERGKRFDLARKKYLEVSTRFPNSSSAEQAMTHLRSMP